MTADALLRWIEENPHNASWQATAKDIREIVTALATREEAPAELLSDPQQLEAPAEAGERECGWCDGRKTKQTPSTDFTIPCPYCKGTGKEALRAQPQAREDATVSPLGGASVGPDEAEEASSVDATPQAAQQDTLGTQDLIKRLEGERCNCGYAGLMAEAAEALQAREVAQPVAVKTLVDAALTYIAGRGHAPGFGPLGKLHEAAWAVKRSPLYTHPAPDALRLAMEALEGAKQIAARLDGHDAEMMADEIEAIDQALAALQAGGKP